MTFLFTTRLKIIAFISVAVIISALFLLGYEFGWQSAFSACKEQQKTISTKPITSSDEIKNSTELKN